MGESMSKLPLNDKQKEWLEDAMLNPLYVRFPQDEPAKDKAIRLELLKLLQQLT